MIVSVRLLLALGLTQALGQSVDTDHHDDENYCQDEDKEEFFGSMRQYLGRGSMQDTCSRFVTDPESFDVETNKAPTCDCLDTLFEEDLARELTSDFDCRVPTDDGEEMSVFEYLRYMKRLCTTDAGCASMSTATAGTMCRSGGYVDDEVYLGAWTEANLCEDQCTAYLAGREGCCRQKYNGAHCWVTVGGPAEGVSVTKHSSTGFFAVYCPPSNAPTDGDVNGEDYCEGPAMLRNEEGCKASSCCHWNTWEAGEASFWGQGRCWSSIGRAVCEDKHDGPSECVDDPSGIVAADPYKDCSNVGDYDGWRCDYFDLDFNGHSVFIWELCPKSCGMCGGKPDDEDSRECQDDDAATFWAMVGGYQHLPEIREMCGGFVHNYGEFGAEGYEEATCGCLETMFEEDIVETIVSRMECDRIEVDNGEYMSPVEYLSHMMDHTCIEDAPPTDEYSVFEKVHVGRVLSWYDYRDLAWQKGGRLPTAMELSANGVSVDYDQWVPVTPMDGDHTTGRNDGDVTSGEENAWANIGPRKYVTEFPAWGLDSEVYDWKRLDYFYMVSRGADSTNDDSRECQDDDAATFWAMVGGYQHLPEISEMCGGFVHNYGEFGAEGYEEATCGCLETMFEEDIVETIASKMECDRIEIDDGEYMSPVEYLSHMMDHTCIEDAPPTNEYSVFEKIHVGRVLSWYDYRDLAWQKGGRLPTAMELSANGVSVEYDQWVPVTPMDGDHTTGRNDGDVTNGEENAWANIGPRKYVTEFPAWGLDSEVYDWKRLDYFYMVSRGAESSDDDDSRECQDEHGARFWAMVGGYQHLPEVREQCGRFVRDLGEEFGEEGHEEETCGCLVTMFDEDIVETLASRVGCDRVEIDDGGNDHMTLVEYLEHIMHHSCHGDHDEDSRECQDDDAATFWAMVGGYQHLQEIREMCGRFVRDYAQLGGEGNEEATCDCLETMFEEDIVETIASRIDCDRIEVDDGEYMSPVEYLEYMMHYSCHEDHEPEGINGEEACEGHDFDQDRCMEVGCCHWNPDVGCMSSVGRETCEAALECTSQTGPAFWAVVGGYRHIPSVNEKCWRFVLDQGQFWDSLGAAVQASGVPADPEWKPACECVDAMFEHEIVETIGEKVNCYIPGEHFGNAMTFHLTSYLRHVREVCGEQDMKICTEDDFDAVFDAIQEDGSKTLVEACPLDMADYAGYCKCLTELYNPRNIMLVENEFPKCHVDLSMPGRWHPDTGSNDPVLMREYLRYDLIECMEYGEVVDPTPGANGEPLSKSETQDVLRNVVEELKMLTKGDLPSARKNLKMLDQDAKEAKQKLKKFAKRVSKKLQN